MKDHLLDARFPDDAFPPSSPADAGLDPAPLQACLDEITRRALPLHGLVLLREGVRVLEQYGTDAGRPLGPDDLHALHSTTKTFTGMLVGRAIADGKLALDTRIAEVFTPGELAACDPAVAEIRVEDLLTMRSGLAYEEGTERDWRALTATPHAAAGLLARPLVAAPGTRWNYSSGDSQLLAELLRRTTGRPLRDLARDQLLAPLGIARFRWDTDADGAALGGTGLWLRPRDLARFAWMLLDGGRWRGAQVVPAPWIEAATRRHVVASSGWTPGEGYGYHCWVPRLGGFATRGYQGQVAYAFPAHRLLLVVTAALEPPERGDALLDELVRTYVLAAVR